MKSSEKTNGRYRKLRISLLVASLALVLGFAFGVVQNPVLLGYSLPVFLFLIVLVLVYASLFRYRRAVLAVLSLAVSLLIVEIFTGGFEVFSGPAEQLPAEAGGPGVLLHHPLLAYWMKPNTEGEVSRVIGDTIVYENVPFQTDDLGRRSCPSGAPTAPFHAIFFGGSFTFGQGLTDEQTLPCAFQELSGGEYRAYNYGQNGYGTGQMYWLLKGDEFFDEEMPAEGLAVYSFIGDHVSRSVGELGKLTYERLPWLDFPLFRFDPDTDELEPFFVAEHPAMSRALRSIRTLRLLSPTARFLFSRIDAPLVPDQEGVRIIAEIIVQSRDLYRGRFSGEFIVVLWPRVGLEMEEEQVFVSLLEDAGIMVLDVPELPDGIPAQIHEQDLHPSPEEVRWVAEYLFRTVDAKNK